MSSQHLPTHVPTTTLLIPNMHCPSCVETITQLLGIPQVKNLNVSLLLHTVTFNIDQSVGTSDTAESSEKGVTDVVGILSREGGYIVEYTGPGGPAVPFTVAKRKEGVLDRLTGLLSGQKAKQRRRDEERRRIHLNHCQVCREGGLHEDDEPTSPIMDKLAQMPVTSASGDTHTILRTTLSIEGMTCASCTRSINSALSSHDSILGVDISLLGSSGTIRHRSDLSAEDVRELVVDAGFDAEIISSIPEIAPRKAQPMGLIRTTVMIEGMTCASCSSAIQTALKVKQGITDISIDVLGNKGDITHTALITADDIVTTIEDVGYDAEVISSRAIDAGIEADQTRQITIRVEGIYCGQCIKKLNSHLSSMPFTFTPFTTHNHSTTIIYTPRQPYTIRDILHGLSNVSPEFEAFVVKDRTLNDRSRDIQQREVRVLFFHWVVALIFAIPTFIIAIVGMALLRSSHPFKQFWMQPKWGAANLGTIVIWPLATVVQFGVGRIFYSRAFTSMKPHLRRLIPSFIRRRPKNTVGRLSWKSFFNFGSMDLLVVLSTSVSYFASLAMLILDVRASPKSMSVGTYFDSCVFLIMFILLGRVLEAYAKSRTTDAISLLGQLRPETALLIENADSKEEERITRQVPVENLERDDLILVPPGSLPPTDGVIVSGSTTLDESSLTGESKPVKKTVGDEIYTGTTNLSSAITVRITSLSGDTMLEKIMAAVSEASGHKAPIEKLAERLTGIFVPIIVYLSLVVLAIWLSISLSGRAGGHSRHMAGGTVFFAIEFAIATLVVACPCGIGLAVPCANAVGTGLFAKNGILASGGGEAFVGATQLDTVVLDKTGTLTVGKSTVTDTKAWTTEGKSEIERMVREVEKGSTHPLAQGIVGYLDEHFTGNGSGASGQVEVASTEEIAGRGIRAQVNLRGDIHDILIGNILLLSDHGVHLGAEQETVMYGWTADAKSVVLIAKRPFTPKAPEATPYTLEMAFALSDPPRPTTRDALTQLREMGMRIMMLSGDNIQTARAVGKMVGIEGEGDVIAAVSPEGKAAVIRQLQAEATGMQAGWMERFRQSKRQRKVMFVGDGLNDSVALATADVAVAMGHGSQATLAGSDFVLLSSNLESLPVLIRLSGKITMRQKLNLAWAIIFNLVCLPFAAGVFYAAGGRGIRLTPVWSAVVMACSSLSVVCSSLALRWGL